MALSMGTFHFLHPAWLFAAPLLLGCALWSLWRERRTGGWASVVDADLLPALRLEQGGTQSSPWALIGAAWTLAALALAGPAWQREQSAGFRAPDDWVVLLDLSPSMAVSDVAPDRATRARYAIDDLLGGAEDARVGLIAFAGEAHTVVPLTSDVATVRSLLPPLSPAIMPESGDQIAPGLDAAGRLLHQAASRNAQVIVLSDGYDDPDAANAAATELRAHGAAVQVVGVGTVAGAPELNAAGGFVQDSQGRSVLVHLRVDELKALAAAGGGRYWSLEQMPALIKALHAQHENPLSAESLGAATQVDVWRNEGVWLLLPLLLMGVLIARRGWL
jgi:Ca-activated chloride channel family protein